MSLRFRTFLCASVAALAACTATADTPNPFGQAGTGASTASQTEDLEFAGVSTIGSKTMINLYDQAAKHGFWIQEGKSSDGVTVVRYDAAHDQVTVRRNGLEKTLPLRAPGQVVNGPASAPPIAPGVAAPPEPVGPAAPMPAPTTATNNPPANTPQARAKQEEEARMLVSDLLEIGIAQRKAYEEAQRRAAAGQSAQPATPSSQSATPETSGQATSTGTTTATPSSR